jgi:hypothetical protein
MAAEIKTQRFNQARDLVSLPGNWLGLKNNCLLAQDKTVAKQSLRRMAFIQHTLGYGPAGYHTINRAIERLAHDCVEDDTASLLDHLKCVQADPLPAQFGQDMNNTLSMMSKLEKTEDYKLKILSMVRERFYHRKTLLGKSCLAITSCVEVLRRLVGRFRKEKIIRSLKEAFGYGPLGYLTLQAIVQNVAQQCIDKILESHLLALQQLQAENADPLKPEQIEPVAQMLDAIYNLSTNRQDIQRKLDRIFWEENNILGKCCLLASRAIEKIGGLFRKKPAAAPLPFQSSYDLYEKLVNADLEFHPLWTAQAGTDTLRLSLATTARCHQIKLYKNDRYIGHAVFRQDAVQQEKHFVRVLAIADWAFEYPSAPDKAVIYNFLMKLHEEAQTARLTWDPGVPIIPVPEQTREYTNSETTKEQLHRQQPLIRKMQDKPEENPFSNLFDFQSIVDAARALTKA